MCVYVCVWADKTRYISGLKVGTLADLWISCLGVFIFTMGVLWYVGACAPFLLSPLLAEVRGCDSPCALLREGGKGERENNSVGHRTMAMQLPGP